MFNEKDFSMVVFSQRSPYILAVCYACYAGGQICCSGDKINFIRLSNIWFAGKVIAGMADVDAAIKEMFQAPHIQVSWITFYLLW